MNLLINIIIVLSFINNILLEPNFGECGKVGYKAINFESCKEKKVYDESNYYCCFLKSGKNQECVEILKKDIDDNAVKVTILEIEKGIYEGWNNDELNLNKIYGKLNKLECDKSFFLEFNGIICFLSIFLILY